VPLCKPQIIDEWPWEQTRACVVGNRQLTTCGMARLTLLLTARGTSWCGRLCLAKNNVSETLCAISLYEHIIPVLCSVYYIPETYKSQVFLIVILLIYNDLWSSNVGWYMKRLFYMMVRKECDRCQS
jgi:hypothetical protein